MDYGARLGTYSEPQVIKLHIKPQSGVFIEGHLCMTSPFEVVLSYYGSNRRSNASVINTAARDLHKHYGYTQATSG